MRCPFCKYDNDKVVDSRASEDGLAIRRRRQCIHCQMRYTTYERVEELSLKVVKKDDAREPYSRDKLRQGIAMACSKRPVSHEQIEKLIGEVEHRVFRECDYEVESTQLGELIMQELRQLDQVAYVRFASVYRDFEDARDFMDEVEPLLQHRRESPRRR